MASITAQPAIWWDLTFTSFVFLFKVINIHSQKLRSESVLFLSRITTIFEYSYECVSCEWREHSAAMFWRW